MSTTNTKLRAAKERVAEQAQMAYSAAIVSVGVFLGLFEVLFGPLPGVIGERLPDILVTVLLFGIIEGPRIEDVRSDFWKLVFTSFVAIDAVLFIQITRPALVQSAAVGTLVLLFIGTVIVSLSRERKNIQAPGLSSFSEYAPRMGVMLGIGALAVIFL